MNRLKALGIAAAILFLTLGYAQAQEDTNVLLQIPVPPPLDLPMFPPDATPDAGNFYSAGRELPPYPFNPFDGLTNVPVYSLATSFGKPANAPFYLFDDRSIVAAQALVDAEEAGQRTANGKLRTRSTTEPTTPQSFARGLAPLSNDLQLDIEDATNGVVSLTILNPTSLTNDPVWDVYATTNLSLATDSGALNATNWTWLARTAPGQTNLFVPMLSDIECYFRLADTNDADGDSLSDAFELLVSHSNPATNDTDGDGLLDGWSWTHFGHVNGLESDQTRAGDDYDGDGIINADEQNAGTDPNTIAFGTTFANLFVNSLTLTGTCNVGGGGPAYRAVLINNTNLATATWQPYTTSNFSITLPDADGTYTVCVALRGLTTNFPPSIDYTVLTLDRVSPVLTSTNPIVTSGTTTVKKPYLQLQGFTTEPLTSITYDVTNAVVWLTNQTAYIVDEIFDTNTFDFSTNYFQAFDIPLATNSNFLILRVTDRAGNQTVTNINVTLSYAGSTAPTLQVKWPPATAQLSGDDFYVRGKIDDETATLVAQVIGGGVTNSVEATVERDGVFWAENLPLPSGTNSITLTATNAAGDVTTTNFNVVKSTLSLSIASTPDGQSLYDSSGIVSGTVSDPNAVVTVNGVAATVESDGSWLAEQVPTTGLGTATYNAIATPASGPQAATSVAKEMPAVIKVVQHRTHEIVRQAGTTRTFDKNFTADYQAGEDGEWHPKYTEKVTDTQASEGFSSTTTYQWSDTNPGGTYRTVTTSGGETSDTSGPINEIEWNISSVPHEDLDHEESNYPYRPNRFTVIHYYASGVLHTFGGPSMPESVSLGANTRMKLYTGGKSGVRRLGLFCLTGYGLEYCRTGEPGSCPWQHTPSTEILPANLTVLGGSIGKDGKRWVVLPDNTSPELSLSARGGAKHYFASAEFTKYPLKITANGSDLSTEKPEFCVGQNVTFTLDGLPTDQIVNMVGRWSLPAKYVNEEWQHSSTIASGDPDIPTTTNYYGSLNYRINDDLLANTNVTSCWFVNKPGGPVTVGMNLEFSNGQHASVAAYGSIALYRPEATPSVQHAGAVSLNGDFYLQDELVVFKSAIRSTYSGEADWTQLINRDTQQAFYVESGTWGHYWLDTSTFYNDDRTAVIPDIETFAELNDAPEVPIDVHVSNIDSFKAYFMFRPTGNNNIWVSLGRMDWGWHGAAYVGAMTDECGITSPTFTNTDEFPEWIDVYQSSEH